uniref:pectinesterase family protein n=1 Tax=uncultured Caulobacter sp. TaxID=158749 RepID=UPI0025FA6120|nr:pectinesterase family protein [uncultured Caulobacter sp.]
MTFPMTRRVALAGIAAAPAVARAATPATATYALVPDIVVAKDGSGQFSTIQAALKSIAPDNRERKVILVRNGFYDEAVRIDAPYVTLRGESRLGVRLQAHRPANETKDEIGQGVVNIGPTAHDFVLEHMTVHNTVTVAGPHAFAVLGRGDRTIIQDADLLSLGADTLALWRTDKSKAEMGLSEAPGATPLSPDGGRYYHTDLRITGAVDFVCPRGWCFMSNSEIVQIYPRAEAAVWHEGKGNADKKFVMKGCTFDGPPNFYLGRHHRDAQFYFLDCAFSERMRDKPTYQVIYPLDGGTPSPADMERNRVAAAETQWGERRYFSNSHRTGGDYAWMADSLNKAQAGKIDAAWTFAGTWNPERTDGPRVIAVATEGGRAKLTFDRLVTVKGAPGLVSVSGQSSKYAEGSGTNTLTFETAGAPARLDFAQGVVIGTEAVAKTAFAAARLPTSRR